MNATPGSKLRATLLALATVTLAACVSEKQTPFSPQNNNPQQNAQVAPAPPGTFNQTVSDSSNLGDRKPDTDVRRRARLRVELAASYYQDGKFGVALDELKQALQLDPTFADAHEVLGLVYMALGQNDLAGPEMEKAIQLDPENPDINVNYGWFLCQTARPKESIPLFLKAAQNPLFNQPARPLQNAGVCSLRMGDKAAAEEYFKRSFALDPSGSVSAYNLGLLYFERHDIERARFYSNIVTRKPGVNAESLWLGIRIEHGLGHKPEELSLGTQLTQRFPNSSEAGLLARGAYDE